MNLLTPTDVRALAEAYGVSPTKKLGQNFVMDAGTVRKIVSVAGVEAGDSLIEVGPGLGSLTLGLLEAGAKLFCVELDNALARELPGTVEQFAPEQRTNFRVKHLDALKLQTSDLSTREASEPLTLVANLPYNVSVPIILHFLREFPNLQKFTVMVQSEVAERLVAGPGSKIYGIPSVKLAYFGDARISGEISREVFWPKPNVDSSLVSFERIPGRSNEVPSEYFKFVDVVFSQRRKNMRKLLAEAGYNVESLDPEKLVRAESLTPAELHQIFEQVK